LAILSGPWVSRIFGMSSFEWVFRAMEQAADNLFIAKSDAVVETNGARELLGFLADASMRLGTPRVHC
jgi:hypothetical protein